MITNVPRAAEIPPSKRAAVPFRLHVDDLRAQPLSDILRPVGAAVVGHDDLADDAVLLQRTSGLLDAAAQRVGLVQAWHHH